MSAPYCWYCLLQLLNVCTLLQICLLELLTVCTLLQMCLFQLLNVCTLLQLLKYHPIGVVKCLDPTAGPVQQPGAGARQGGEHAHHPFRHQATAVSFHQREREKGGSWQVVISCRCWLLKCWYGLPRGKVNFLHSVAQTGALLKLRWIRGGERFLQLVNEAARGKLLHEKILKSKILCQTPFNGFAMGGEGCAH